MWVVTLTNNFFMKLKHVLLTAAMMALPFAPLALNPAHAALGDQLDEVNEGAGLGGDASSLTTTIGSLIAVLLGFLGVIFLILIIYAGLLWMTAAGNEDNVKKAKSILLNSVIGLVILLSAYAISSFVIDQLGTATGTS